ncbi:uncharacterized protein LOC134537290 [Bacillus rossius redtenbacheri]|uniref:uncharacterized protein LOC134537290 n=1 Tax=Bacillus rossius redtenbacheri TaxID=93214 RepID=UPI002FDDAA10
MSELRKKKLPGTRPYKSYTDAVLQQVLEDIKAGKIGHRQAEREYGIPRNTIRNKLKRCHEKAIGRPQAFTEIEEQSFVNHVITCSEFGMPLSMCDVRFIVKGYLDSTNTKVPQFKNNLPGVDWGRLFLKRHKAELGQRFASNISRSRAQVSEDMVKHFFVHLEKEIEGVLPCNIYNYDETGFHDVPSKKKLLFRRGSRHPELILNSTKSCFTTMFCGNALGEFLPPYVILKGKQKWSDWLKGAPPGTRLNVTLHGWIDQDVFDDWFENHFLPFALKHPGKKVLIGDNMSAHLTLKTLKLCTENNISFVMLIPNSTHLLQPLDVAYFSSLKSNWRKILYDWRQTREGKRCVALPKSLFCQLLKFTLDMGEPTASSNLVKGFLTTGIHPIDKDKVIQKLPQYAKEALQITDNVGECFKSFISEVRSSDLDKVQRSRKFKLPIEPGRSVSVEEVETFYDKKILCARSGPKTRGGVRKFPGRCKVIKPNRPREGEHIPCTSTSESRDVVDVCVSSTIHAGPTMLFEDCTSEHASPTVLMEDSTCEHASPTVLMEDSTCEYASPTVLIEDCTSDTIITTSTVVINRTDGYKVNDYVIVVYDGHTFPGTVTCIAEEENELLYKVKCMATSGGYWRWPDHPDEIFYRACDVICKIPPCNIEPVSGRGHFKINEPLLLSKVVLKI